MAVRFRYCPLFAETFARHPEVESRLKSFIDLKTWSPLQAFGKKDETFSGGGIFNKTIPGLRHAHLTMDISVLYTIGGRDPTTIDLYGIFTHAESGTGQPSNLKKQRSLAARLANQAFDSRD
jgi:hypothetical protein